jgi:hypothetical protein
MRFHLRRKRCKYIIFYFFCAEEFIEKTEMSILQ